MDNSHPAGVEVCWEQIPVSLIRCCHLKLIWSRMVISETQWHRCHFWNVSITSVTTNGFEPALTLANQWQSYCVIVGMLRDLFMMRRTSTSGRLSCLVWAHPSSAAAMCRSKRSDTDFFRSLGFPLKKEPSHCLITLSMFSVLNGKRLQVRAIKDGLSHDKCHLTICIRCLFWQCMNTTQMFSIDVFLCLGLYSVSVFFVCEQLYSMLYLSLICLPLDCGYACLKCIYLFIVLLCVM